MKKIALLVCGATMAWGQATQPATPAAKPAPPFSQTLLKGNQYSAAEDARIVKLYENIRFSDVIDGLDVVGLQDITIMDPEIRPSWRDQEKFTHRIVGVAVTVRLVPAQETSPKFASHLAERAWEAGGWNPPAANRTQTGRGGAGYGAFIRPGTVLVVDNGARDDGFCGSNMGMGLAGRGLAGFVGNKVCRDMDEMTLLKIPVYQGGYGLNSPRGINQGRMWVESYNQPITVGGVLVLPGDIIVADADGVAVVPRAKAEEVAKIARWIYEDDEIKRRNLYEKTGRKPDWTVEGIKPPAPPSDAPINPDAVWTKRP